MKRLSVLTVLLILAMLSNVAGAAGPQQPGASGASSECCTFQVTILHTNDFHARVDGQADIGGTARLMTAIRQARAEQPNVLLLDAGDQFQGTLYYRLFKADVITATMNALAYDAMTIGNHEFDDGPGQLARLIDGAGFPVLSANLDVAGEPLLAGKIAPSTVVTLSGQPIGIVGLTTPEMASISSTGPNVIVLDPAASLQTAVNQLTAQGIDKVVAVTHVGYDADKALAASISGVDVIVGGHSHTFLYSPASSPQNGDVPAGPYPTVVRAPDGNPVLIVSAYQWSRYLGRLDVTFGVTGTVSGYAGNPIFLDTAVPKDPLVEAVIGLYRPQVDALKNTFIGTSMSDMPVNVAGARICRTGECALGDLVTDAMLWKVNLLNPTHPYQIALMNGGGLPAPIDMGPISVGEVLEVVPYGNTLATFEITGTLVLQALENSVSRIGETSGTGRLGQVAGLRYAFDPKAPAGARLLAAEVLSGTTYVPVDGAARYRVVTNNFMRLGGDGYTVFRDYALNPYDFGPQLDEALIDYIAAFSPISRTLEGRIHALSRYYLPMLRKAD